MKINFFNSEPREALLSPVKQSECDVRLGAQGGGITLSEVKNSDKRYIVGDIEVLEDHSVAMMFRVYLPGEKKERICFRFGLLPQFKTRICLDLSWLDNHTIFTNRTPGTLKLVIHGLRTDRNQVDRFELGIEKTFHDVKIHLENFYLTNELPQEFPIPDKKLVDEFGQWKLKDWPGKINSLNDLKTSLKASEGSASYPFPEYNQYGGDSLRKLRQGTGFFSTLKTGDGRWHLIDPDGCDYFSMGPCGIRPGDPCRIDHFEKNCDWLPEDNDPQFKEMMNTGSRRRTPYMPVDHFKMTRFVGLNLKRVYGENWKQKWEELSYHILMKYGVNSQGNFSELNTDKDRIKLPYVRQLHGFPSTETRIFRDFPDVLSPQYRENSEKFAQTLAQWQQDPWLIGYFLRNEPEFNFVAGLAMADEVLRNPAQTYCRKGLIEFLRERYQTIEALNESWNARFGSFADFKQPINNCSVVYPLSEKDIREFSALLIREYVKIPSLACRSVDKNHLNLGLRWSKANNPVMMSGWEYFDVFSINCYDFDPTRDMDFVKNANVDLPILLGEFHCGALDMGLTATGLKGVENQVERGIMFRNFVEKVAAHPYGVGAHWFQFNDQFCLGRYDGENYQIGMVDICMQPHQELMEAVYQTAKVLYSVKNGETKPFDQKPKSIPMIGY